MQKRTKLSLLCLGLMSASFLLTTTATAANYKGDSYKGEAMAAPCPQPLQLRDGFYVGVQGGYDSYRIRVSRAVTLGGIAFAGNPVIDSTGWVGGLFGGYGMYFSNMYYLGGEVFVNDSGANQNQSSGVLNTTYNKTSIGGSYGISLLPGLKLNDSSLGYIRLGYNRAHIQGQEILSPAGVAFNSGSNWNWKGGFNYGLGLETAIYPNMSLRTEFTHTDFGSFNAPVTHSTFKASDNQFMLGLNYHFA